MTIDYTISLGLGREIEIDYNTFKYDKWNKLQEGFTDEYGFEIDLVGQIYKQGKLCYCTLFVGKILHSHDARHVTKLPVDNAIKKIKSSDFTEDEKSKLDKVCDILIGELELEGVFARYGVSLLARCW